MPGLLIMDKRGADGVGNSSSGPGRDTDIPGREPGGGLAVQGGTFKMADGKAMPNGDRSIPQVDGLTDNFYISSLPNGTMTPPTEAAKAVSGLDQLPPELLHVTDGYISLGKLIARVTQDCYNGLCNTVDSMLEAAESHQGMANGYNHGMANGVGVSQEESMAKKQLLLDFANGARERFIRLLVISQWSRNVDDVSRLIDLHVWCGQQTHSYQEVADAVGILKHSLYHLKIPNPDIRTALEVLSTGKASWISDMGFLPLPPLSPQRVLKWMQNMDTKLSIRLNLHEELPRHLKNWSVGSGRATFVIPGEFELDVGIYDEDSPFFFADLRFLFTPAPDIPDSVFRDHLKWRANDTLRDSGLSGCYDFLHNFVLTHKLSIFNRQANDLLRANWASQLTVELVRRTLAIRYWAELPGPKSWIEIGINSGRPKDGKIGWRGPKPPYLSLRWMRCGKETATDAIVLDWTNLSLERLLKNITAQHITYILTSIRDRLLTFAQSSRRLTLELSTSLTEPVDCSLSIRINSFTSPITLTIDPVTGRVSISPPSTDSSEVDRRMNDLEDLASQAPTEIAKYLCSMQQTKVGKTAELCGWAPLRTIRNLKAEQIKALVRQDIVKFTFFQGQGWGQTDWTLLVTVNLSGVSWWIAELTTTATGHLIKDIKSIPSTAPGARPRPPSLSSFRKLERLALCEISTVANARDLKQHRVPHTFGKQIYPRRESRCLEDALSLSSTNIKFSTLLGARAAKRSDHWTADILGLSYDGHDKESGKIRYVAYCKLRNPKTLRHLITNTHDDHVAFHADGHFSVTTYAKLGAPCIREMVSRLKAIDRIRRMVETLEKLSLSCEVLSLSQIKLGYAEGLSTTISLHENDPMRAKFAPDNPHRRIHVLLNAHLNSAAGGAGGFEHFVHALDYSLPALRALDTINRRDPAAPHNPRIFAQNIDCYKISYQSFPVVFEVRAKKPRAELMWTIEETGKKGEQWPRELQEALRSVFKSGSGGTDWRGFQTMIVARPEGVGPALLKLDEIIRPLKGKEGGVNGVAGKTEPIVLD